MKKSIGILVICIFALMLSACSGKKTIVNEMSAYVSYETQCIDIDSDGNQTLRVWGNGVNKSDAIESAKKKALEDVIFKGIRSGCHESAVRPLIYEVNAQEKYESYFTKFFSKKGDFKKYVEFSKRNDYTEASGTNQKNVAVLVVVKRNELKQKLIQDGILKP